MPITRREALQGLADQAGLAATTTVGEIAELRLALEPRLKLPKDLPDYRGVQLRNVRILPSALVTFLLTWLKSQQYCQGPPPDYAYLFCLAPDLNALYPGSFRPEFGPVYYRGRLDGSARLLVIGQDPSTDEQIANRSFVGSAGQRLQGLLRRLGLTRSYIIINTFHLGVHGTYSSNPKLKLANADPTVFTWRNQFINRLIQDNNIEAILTVGTPAREAIRQYWPQKTQFLNPSRIVDIRHPSAPGGPHSSWNTGLTRLGNLVNPDVDNIVDLSPYGNVWTNADSVDIPRRDLPFGTPPWHGTGAETKSQRNGAKSITWSAP